MEENELNRMKTEKILTRRSSSDTQLEIFISHWNISKNKKRWAHTCELLYIYRITWQKCIVFLLNFLSIYGASGPSYCVNAWRNDCIIFICQMLAINFCARINKNKKKTTNLGTGNPGSQRWQSIFIYHILMLGVISQY